MGSAAYNRDKATVDANITQASQADPYNSTYKSIAQQAASAPSIGSQDWSDVDQAQSGLSTIAQAFMRIYSQGSPVAAAQNNILNGQLERAAVSGQASGAQIQNQGQQNAATAGSNVQTQQNNAASSATQISSFSNLAGLKEAGIKLQLTHAAAQEAIQKQALASQSNLAAASSLEAQQAMISNARASEQQIQTGQDALTFQNWANGFSLAGGAAASGLAVGSKLSGTSTNSNTSGVNPVSTATSLSNSDEENGVTGATVTSDSALV